MKQYTESELRAEFEKPRIEQLSKHTDIPSLPKYSDGEYIDETINTKWRGFLEASRFLGALSEAHKETK